MHWPRNEHLLSVSWYNVLRPKKIWFYCHKLKKIGSIGNNFYALYFCASCIRISIVRRHFLLQKWMISRFPYLLKMFTSSAFGYIISSQVTVLRQWVLEKQDYIIMSYITQFSNIWKWVSNVRKWITHIKKWHLLKKISLYMCIKNNIDFLVCSSQISRKWI